MLLTINNLRLYLTNWAIWYIYARTLYIGMFVLYKWLNINKLY